MSGQNGSGSFAVHMPGREPCINHMEKTPNSGAPPWPGFSRGQSARHPRSASPRPTRSLTPWPDLGPGGRLGGNATGLRLPIGSRRGSLGTHTQHSLSYTAEIVAWRLGGSPGTVVPMSPNRNDLKPDRRPQEQERARRRGVLIREAYWALFIAIIVVGGAKLVARAFGGL